MAQRVDSNYNMNEKLIKYTYFAITFCSNKTVYEFSELYNTLAV